MVLLRVTAAAPTLQFVEKIFQVSFLFGNGHEMRLAQLLARLPAIAVTLVKYIEKRNRLLNPSGGAAGRP
jgi:hypothetical protein